MTVPSCQRCGPVCFFVNCECVVMVGGSIGLSCGSDFWEALFSGQQALRERLAS